MITTIDKKGETFLAAREGGYKLKPYKCPAGVPTISAGCTYYENGVKVKLTDPCLSMNRAVELFMNTVKPFEARVLKRTKGKLNQNQFSACVSLAYNIGIESFEKSTVARLIDVNPNDQAIEHAFKMWRFVNAEHDGKDNDHDGAIDEKGEKREDLLPRRILECKLYFSK